MIDRESGRYLEPKNVGGCRQVLFLPRATRAQVRHLPGYDATCQRHEVRFASARRSVVALAHTPHMEIQLRDYQIRHGHMDDWIAGWKRGIAPARERTRGVAVAISFAILLLSPTFHEDAHAWTAAKLVEPPARALGGV